MKTVLALILICFVSAARRPKPTPGPWPPMNNPQVGTAPRPTCPTCPKPKW